MIVQLEEFTGEAPRWHPRALQAPYAQEAILTRFDRRTLAPYKQIDPKFTTVKVGTMKTIYRFGYETDSDTSYWFHWADEVSVIRSPSDVGSERTYLFGDGAPKVTDSNIAIGSPAAYPVDTYRLGIPPPLTPSLVVSGTATSDVVETRAYLATLINAWGEEGPPSEVTDFVDVKPGEIVTLDISQAIPSGDYNLTGGFKKIYRVGSGESTAAFLSVGNPVAIATASFVDTVPGGQLGGELTSTEWGEPLADMEGAALMPNGIILAWRENEVWPSEPFVPYAYPTTYVVQTDSAIVGIAVMGQTAVVVTKGQPWLISGVHPTSMVMEKLDAPQAGSSRRGILAVDGGVVYVSPDGIVSVTGRQAEVITRDMFTREDWQALNPSSMHLAAHEGRLFCFYDNESLGGTPGGLIIDFLGERQSVVHINQYFSAAYTDMKRDALFLCGDDSVLFGEPGVSIGAGATSQLPQVTGLISIGGIATSQEFQRVDATGVVYSPSASASAVASFVEWSAAPESSASAVMVEAVLSHVPIASATYTAVFPAVEQASVASASAVEVRAAAALSSAASASVVSAQAQTAFPPQASVCEAEIRAMTSRKVSSASAVAVYALVNSVL